MASHTLSYSLDNVQDNEIEAHIRGVQATMHQFKFLFGCHLGKIKLTQADNLSLT